MPAELFVVSAKQRCSFVTCGIEGPAFEATHGRQVHEVTDLTIVVAPRPRQAEAAEARCRRYEVIPFSKNTDGDAVSTETPDDRQANRRTADNDRAGAAVAES
jgi:hypothetical protein